MGSRPVGSECDVERYSAARLEGSSDVCACATVCIHQGVLLEAANTNVLRWHYACVRRNRRLQGLLQEGFEN